MLKTGKLSLIFKKIKSSSDIIDLIQQAGAFSIVEGKYLRQSPQGLTGDLRGEIKTERIKGGFATETKATSNGKPYPLFLTQGTGRLKGANDFGFTKGRVNADDVLYGIGGIRPNKFNVRAAEDAEKPVNNYVNKQIKALISNKIKI